MSRGRYHWNIDGDLFQWKSPQTITVRTDTRLGQRLGPLKLEPRLGWGLSQPGPFARPQRRCNGWGHNTSLRSLLEIMVTHMPIRMVASRKVIKTVCWKHLGNLHQNTVVRYLGVAWWTSYGGHQKIIIKWHWNKLFLSLLYKLLIPKVHIKIHCKMKSTASLYICDELLSEQWDLNMLIACYVGEIRLRLGLSVCV